MSFHRGADSSLYFIEFRAVLEPALPALRAAEGSNGRSQGMANYYMYL